MSGLSQLERGLISQRTKEGLVPAKEKGRNGGRYNKQNGKSVMALYGNRIKIVDIVKNTDLSVAQSAGLLPTVKSYKTIRIN